MSSTLDHEHPKSNQKAKEWSKYTCAKKASEGFRISHATVSKTVPKDAETHLPACLAMASQQGHPEGKCGSPCMYNQRLRMYNFHL